MATESRTGQLVLCEKDGPKWPKHNASVFELEYDSRSDSPILSSGYESVLSEDLDLYDDTCVC